MPIMNKRTCQLHGTPLNRVKVPISYGLPAYDPAWSVEKELFPHSKTAVLGGCLIDPDNPDDATVLVCFDCRAAEEKWRSENPPEVFWARHINSSK